MATQFKLKACHHLPQLYQQSSLNRKDLLFIQPSRKRLISWCKELVNENIVIISPWACVCPIETTDRCNGSVLHIRVYTPQPQGIHCVVNACRDEDYTVMSSLRRRAFCGPLKMNHFYPPLSTGKLRCDKFTFTCTYIK